MTTEDWRDVLGEGLTVALELPIAGSERELTTSDAVAHLLDAIAVLEENPQAHAKEEPPPPELARLELKIDLLMDLVTTLLADKIPKRSSILVSNDGCVFPAGVMVRDSRRLELYPCHWLAQPVVLELGQVRCLGDQCGARWGSPDPNLRDALGRWVFRMHRRDVARRRLQTGDARLETSQHDSRRLTHPD
jgi:hypothetical protein